MSVARVAALFCSLLLGSACAEGATGAGTTSGAGLGGNGPSGSGGAGQGGSTSPSGTGGEAQGSGGDGAAPSSSSGGDGGDGPSSSTASTGDASSSDASSSAMSSTSSGQADPGTVYFSEYVEGSGNNKALEIYNAGGTPIDLGNCRLDRYQNGASAPAPFALENTTLVSGDVFVVCQSNFAQPGRCDQTTADLQHNGDDAVALVCDGATKDIFGRIGEQPPDGWGSGLTSSEDATLRRKCSVTVGDTNGSDAFDPATQWDGFGVDVFDDLGTYVCP